MSLPEWIVPAAAGFYCRPGDFFFDPRRPVHRAVITHAHADHYPRGVSEAFATPATHAIASVRYKNLSHKTQLHSREYGETFRLGETKLSFLPSGHMLGSAQVLVEYAGENVLFTGDLNTQPDLTCEPLKTPAGKVDVLICESTFGQKSRHSSAPEALQACLSESGGLPLLIGVYPAGKAQWVNRLLSDLYPELPVFVHAAIVPYHHAYENLGVNAGKYSLIKRSVLKHPPGKVAVLVPALHMSSYARDLRFHKVMATGWDKRRQIPHLNGVLDLSGHADAKGIREYIDRISPGRVVFWHGYPRLLMKYCEERKIPAIHVNLPQISGR